MKSSCETKEEYVLSKRLMLKFVNSTYVTNKLGTLFPKNFETFFRNNVETHEMNFCYYKRKELRHYSEYTNSCHEGTNKGIKYCSAPVLPGHSLAKSCIIMSKNAERSVTKKKHENTKVFCSTRPHSTISCGNYLVENCECRLQTCIDNLPNYQCQIVSKNHWLICKKKTQ